MGKHQKTKLNDAMDKKASADQSWQRTYDSLGEKVDIDRIYLGMNMCDMADTNLMKEEHLDGQRKILRIHIDEDSAENVLLEVERIAKLRFTQELLKLKEPYVTTTIHTKNKYRRESATNS